MSKEKISLSGSTPEKQKPTTTEAAPEAEATKKPRLQLSPEATDDMLVDSIINAPDDQVIPWETVELPSKGLYYPWSSGVIEARGWNLAVDEIIATARLANTGQSLDYVFRECCRFPAGFDPVDLLVGDQMFLLYYLRGLTFGPTYEFASTCPNSECKKTNTNKADLVQLAQTITWADEAWGTEPFPVKLPYLSETIGRDFTVKVRLLRVRDVQSIQKMRRAKNLSEPGQLKYGRKQQITNSPVSQDAVINDTLTQNLELIVTEVMGVTEQFKIRQLVKKLHSMDTSTIRVWLADHTPGIETVVTITCPHCDTEYPAQLPITEEFFRPSPKRTARQ